MKTDVSAGLVERPLPVRDELGDLREDISRMGNTVVRQLRSAVQSFHASDLRMAESVIETDDLVDNLNLRVESRCFDLMRHPDLSEGEYRAARSILRVALNLERIGDAATSISTRVRIAEREKLERETYDLGALARVATASVEEGVRAFLEEDLTLARRACEREVELDALYIECIAELVSALESRPAAARFYFHILATIRHLEQVGDFVLNIGEQAIYLITGRRLKFNQFQELDSLLGTASADTQFRPYFDGISGALVARVGDAVPFLYKEGSSRKIDEEVAKSEAWERIDSRLIPRVVSSVSLDDRRALLREFVDGVLLSQIYFEQTDQKLQETVTARLLETVRHVWDTTLVSKPPRVDYVGQTRDRLPEVFAFHPALREMSESRFRYRNVVCLPLEGQLQALEGIEPGLAPSFCVWLHGDFNCNNVVYNPDDGGLKFIDIHRSRLGDYLQDFTVFLVGLRRQPDLPAPTRRRLQRIEAMIMAFLREFAEQHEDRAWERRLRLGLGRAYITSARVILHPAHSEWLFRQGRLCFQKVINDE